jgi:hypothetical protein
METEIRKFGDGETLVVYTEDFDLCEELKQWESCQGVIPYWHPKASNPREYKATAFDLYFPKRMRRQLRRACGITGKRKTWHQSPTAGMAYPEEISNSDNSEGGIIHSSHKTVLAGR